jgi:acyl-coenzyme A synthetase/AMP-(fatty) acid ligase
LNHHLNSIEGVSDGAFWMPPDAGSGDVVRPVAFVVSPTLSAAQVGQALQQRLDAVFVPRRIVLLPVIPRESTGKVTAGTLQALAQQHGLA